MKNYERIRQMSIEEMADFIKNDIWNVCDCCIFAEDKRCYRKTQKCKHGIQQWLESEAEE